VQQIVGPSLSQEALERAAALLVGQPYDAGPAIQQAMEMGQAIMDRNAAPEAVEKALLRLHMLMYQVQTVSGFSSAGYLWQVRSAPQAWLCAHPLWFYSVPKLFCLSWPRAYQQEVTLMLCNLLVSILHLLGQGLHSWGQASLAVYFGPVFLVS
jgi:hypothetical protein